MRHLASERTSQSATAPHGVPDVRFPIVTTYPAGLMAARDRIARLARPTAVAAATAAWVIGAVVNDLASAEILDAQRLRACLFTLDDPNRLVPTAFHGRAEAPRTVFTRGPPRGATSTARSSPCPSPRSSARSAS